MLSNATLLMMMHKTNGANGSIGNTKKSTVFIVKWFFHDCLSPKFDRHCEIMACSRR